MAFRLADTMVQWSDSGIVSKKLQYIPWLWPLIICLNFELLLHAYFLHALHAGIRRRALGTINASDGGRVAGMPSTAAEQRTRRRAVKRAARRANSSVCCQFVMTRSTPTAMAPTRGRRRRVRRQTQRWCALPRCITRWWRWWQPVGLRRHRLRQRRRRRRLRQRRRGRRVRRRSQRWCALPASLHHQVAAGRTQSDNSNDGPGAALADSASHELSDGDAAACSALYGSAVLTHCQRALQLLHDGGVRASTAAAAAPHARAHPFPLSDLILLARAAACSTAVPQLPSAAFVRRACLGDSVQAVDVIVDALGCIRSAVSLRRNTDRRRTQAQRAKHGRNDAAVALDQLHATDWSDLLVGRR